jgi:hypothetical protein
MSCDNNPNRVARWASQVGAGIAQLAGKRGFYAGLALAGSGLLGAGLVTLARRQSDTTRKKTNTAASVIMMKPIPQLPPRTKIKPATDVSPNQRCQGCHTLARNKQGPWYGINNRRYCPDCAPAAAQQADLELVSPGVTNAGADSSANGRTLVRTGHSREVSAGRARAQEPAYLPPERRVETRLEPSRIGLNIGTDREPAGFVVEQGYVLLRPDGLDTGLAISPDLNVERRANGQVQVEEDTSRWWITHIASGRTLVNQPYSSLAEAQMLGNILAQIDWTRDEGEIPAAEYHRASATIALYNQTLAQANKEVRQTDGLKVMAVSSGAGEGVNQTGTRRLPTSTQKAGTGESLAGKLVADGYGGVSRVLEDTGDKLFLIDSLGHRYEITRNEARTPDETDFELCRVAMSFDPARQQDTECAKCNRSTAQTGTGEMWYKMGWQAFCESCATEHAAEEGYIKEEEIDANLETLG